jgi:hypothetical protein
VDTAVYGRKDAAWARSVAVAGDSMTGALKLADGTVAAPGLAWASEPGLGWYRAGAGHIGMASGGGVVADFNVSTNNSDFQIHARAAGSNATLTLVNAPVAGGNFNAVQLISGTPLYGLQEALGGSATAKPFRIGFPAGVTVDSLLTVSGGVNASDRFANTSSYNAGGGANAANIWETSNVNGWNIRSRSMANATRAFWQLLIGASANAFYEFDQNAQASKSAGSPSWVISSDASLKKDVQPYGRGLDAVLAVMPRSYTRKDTGLLERGIIAQELQPVLPEAITKAEDGTLQFDAWPITLALVNAVKTLNDRLTALETRVAALECA